MAAVPAPAPVPVLPALPGQIQIALPAAPAAPPTAQDVHDAVDYERQVKRARREFGAGTVPTATYAVTDTVAYTHKVVGQQYADGVGAPAWAAGLVASVTALTTAVARMEARFMNSQAQGQDQLDQVLEAGGAPVPGCYPVIKEDIYRLTRAECDTLLAYYNIVMPAGTSVMRKRARIAREIGASRHLHQ